MKLISLLERLEYTCLQGSAEQEGGEAGRLLPTV